MMAAIGTVMDRTHGFQFVKYALAGSARNEIDETCVAKIDKAIAQVGSFPPPVMNSPAASPSPLRKKKLHPNSVVPTR
ncbi:MAG TPA: hypothetical protein P5527_01025 [Kiritimatiellia bacterium]|nr:hypothetical protein [Kiritimatiellia bacterium]